MIHAMWVIGCCDTDFTKMFESFLVPCVTHNKLPTNAGNLYY